MLIGALNLSRNHSIIKAIILQRKLVRNFQFILLKVCLFASALSIVADVLIANTIPIHNE
jgi:hypothetical protein